MQPYSPMTPWNVLTDTLNELDSIRGQLVAARAQERTVRFHHLLRTRMIGANRGEHVGDVIEISEGWSIVHWLHDPRSIGLYSSNLSMRTALHVGDEVVLSLVDASERRASTDSRQSQTYGQLTPMQRRMLVGLGQGLSNTQIGERLTLSRHTVKNNLAAAYKVLRVSSRIEAALLVRELDLSD